MMNFKEEECKYKEITILPKPIHFRKATRCKYQLRYTNLKVMSINPAESARPHTKFDHMFLNNVENPSPHIFLHQSKTPMQPHQVFIRRQ